MKAWLYYRLSRDEDEEMNSLQNQRQILIDYAEQNGYEVVGESFDDNVSGMTFNRKGLGELESAVDEGKVEVVLVKDLSRLGRHRTQTALFIDHLRENKVKVISVTEGIDTTNENDDLLIGFKQIFNDFYAKDISKKVRAGIRQKQKNSGLVPSLPFGYYLDRNTGKVEIDNETADYIREIFRLYVDGYGLCTIAKTLNERGIRSPEYYQKRKLADWKPIISRQYLWEQTSIKRILSNEMYIGTLVNHKTVTSKIYKTKTFVAPEEQYRHENFCEPIIDRHTWEQAQFLLKQRSEIKPRASNGRKIHRYSGLIKCAECGSCFIAKNRTWRGREYVEYTCNSNHRYGKQYCTPHRIHESQLDELVFGEVQNLKEKIVAESEKYEEIVKQWLKQKPAYDLQIRQYEEKILVLKQQIEDLIIGKVTDKSRAEFYDSMIEKRENEIADLQKKISDCHEYDKVCKQRQQALTSTSMLLDDILSEGRISDANLRMLVNGVVVHQNEDKSLDVCFEMNGDFTILDLLDNCLDGVIRASKNCSNLGKARKYESFWAEINISSTNFSIRDNCGGIPRDTAENYAFRMGRSSLSNNNDPTIGIYGIGMKRAIFKIGQEAIVHTKNNNKKYSVIIDKGWASDNDNWNFPIKEDLSDNQLTENGTEIYITTLNEAISNLWKNEETIFSFVDTLKKAIQESYSLIIEKGFVIKINNETVSANPVELLVSSNNEGIRPYVFTKSLFSIFTLMRKRSII